MKFNLEIFEDIRNQLPINVEKDIKLIIEKMSKENIPVSGWVLEEIPIERTYCFFNPYRLEAFDIEVNHHNLIVLYRDKKGDKEAQSIREAIQKYHF